MCFRCEKCNHVIHDTPEKLITEIRLVEYTVKDKETYETLKVTKGHEVNKEGLFCKQCAANITTKSVGNPLRKTQYVETPKEINLDEVIY